MADNVRWLPYPHLPYRVHGQTATVESNSKQSMAKLLVAHYY